MKRRALYKCVFATVIWSLSTLFMRAAEGTEIVIANSREGVLVTSDKRSTYKGQHDDTADKTKVVSSNLVTRAGGTFFLKSGRKKKYFLILDDIFETAVRNSKIESLLSSEAQAMISKEICTLISQEAKKENLNWKLCTTGEINLLLMKKSTTGTGIDNAIFDIKLQHKAGRTDIQCLVRDQGTAYPDRKLIDIIGSTFTKPTDAPKLIFETLSDAALWSEKEIAKTHKRDQNVGSSVDEFVINYDGQISQYASAKQLERN